MFQVYPIIDVNQKEFLLTIEEFYKDGVPFISAKFHEVANETVDIKDGGTVEQRYSHAYKYYYEKPYSQFSSVAWQSELKEMHNEAMSKEKLASKPKHKKFKINRFANPKLREAKKRSENKKDDDQREA
ncbi:hypothetical protein M3Y14_34465 (plasmid) [Bacillus thuringiensis]|uniref:hypothetical protein n=1 Tax=Bacillus thuringiensis TaxID=1428 RepID=UPI0022246991|nr:hypothetical protein [Bacillus thuringiensis]UYX56088.1 hypothetical protein M3Y14_34465 [Bacillus thuringiensis]